MQVHGSACNPDVATCVDTARLRHELVAILCRLAGVLDIEICSDLPAAQTVLTADRCDVLILSGVAAGTLRMPTRSARDLATNGLGKGSGDSGQRLSARERTILVLLADGLSNKQIGRRLEISEHGAKRLVANVLLKLNSPNRTVAVASAIREGIIT